MRNIKLIIQYDGADFSGWQTQPGKRTVQKTLEDILSKILQEKIQVVGTSRTDSGVHALGQVAHFHTKSKIVTHKLFRALNGLLPEDLSVHKIQNVPLSFHAQKNALRKTYHYRIWNNVAHHPLQRRTSWHVWKKLDLKKMRIAAHYLIGQHDFAAFRATDSQTKTSVRKIYKITIRRGEDLSPSEKISPLHIIEIIGDGFLKYMVRNLVGTLVEVGKGRWKPEKVKEILQSKDRRQAAVTAPPQGLFLHFIKF